MKNNILEEKKNKQKPKKDEKEKDDFEIEL